MNSRPSQHMTRTQAGSDPAGRPFRLVKFFAYASLVVFLISSLPFSMLIARNAKDFLMRSYENYALLLGENLNYQVFQNFVIPVTARFGKIRLRDEKQYEWMDKVVRNTIHGFNIELVNIYDIGKGVIAYSTDPRLLGKKVPESLGYKRALEGENSSGLISAGDDLWGLGMALFGGEKKLRTYIPFRGVGLFAESQGYILGIFEVIQDLTREYEAVNRLQYVIFGLSSLIMGLIFIALLLIVRKAETTIETRAQEQRRLEDQLNQAERLASLGRVVAGVSHEIRNPLGIIRSTAELLAGMPDTGEPQKRLLRLIVEESARLNNTVTEFLDFARPPQPNLQDCDIGEVFHRLFTFLDPELERQGVNLIHNLDQRPYPLKADPQLLYRGFLNILMNAVQASQEGDQVAVHLEDGGDHYRVEVVDTGCGIPDKHMKRIFDPFFSTKDKGSGLGLSIVKNIVEGHKGSLSIQSREGEGTRVEVILPKEPASPPNTKQGEQEAEGARGDG